jgi:DNA-binding ferritin-like protein
MIPLLHIQKKEKKMYELIQHLIAFKYACKINHWSTDNYSKHLMFDRLSEDIDTWVDSIAETYFMVQDKKSVFKSDLLNSKFINTNLVKSCEKIISLLEDLQNDGETNEGLNSLLSAIEEGFLNKLAIAKLK